MSEGTTCHKRVKCTQRGTAHIVPVPGVMGVKDFALNYANIFERYKFWKIWQFFSEKGRIIGSRLYVWELILISAWSRTARDIKFMAREEGNGSILMSKQVGFCSSPFLTFLMSSIGGQCVISLVDDVDDDSVDHYGEILATQPNCGGGGRNYDCWLGAAAKFLLSENSDKTPLTELAKNQAFPLFMAACGWRRPGFFTPSVTFENRASRNPDVFLAQAGEKKLLSMSRHLVISWASYGYGVLWAHALCPTYFLYTRTFSFLNMA